MVSGIAPTGTMKPKATRIMATPSRLVAYAMTRRGQRAQPLWRRCRRMRPCRRTMKPPRTTNPARM